MTLLPFAIDPFGRLGPLARAFLFGTAPTHALTFPPSRPHAFEMHRRVTSFPSPIGIFPHADHAWSTTRTRRFFGHSFTAPTPSITTLQHLGLCICKSFASHTFATHQKSSVISHLHISHDGQTTSQFLPMPITLGRNLT